MSADRNVLVWSLLLALIVAGCAGNRAKDGPPRSGSAVPRELPPDPVPRSEPRSAYGNGPIYAVNGHSYQVLDSSFGYRETGVASWYGRKFHGRLTSNKEPYDMYAMTAAHKSLPLPTYVTVRNLRNNKSVIVRVNDRGPFVHNRIIDVSYAAARKLDMIGTGTSLVEVTAISFDEPAARQSFVAAPVAERPEPPKPATSPPERDSTVYVQVGAFGDAENARRRYALLRGGGIGDAFVLEDNSVTPALYRIRIGPIDDVSQYDTLVNQLRDLGILETHLVTE